MGDDAQVIDDALAVLKEIQREYRNEPVAHLAALMSQQIRPTMAFDSALEERQRIYERTPKEFAEAAAKTLAKRGPGYKTPVFKCLEDFEKCKNSSSSKHLCRAALAICIGKHLIPFVRHEQS
ncbi:MAG: hypothetical protein ABSE67_09205 [Xanthobacteraceae bacterium]|jgi:hypothetical protein